jgi:hypothetical protein
MNGDGVPHCRRAHLPRVETQLLLVMLKTRCSGERGLTYAGAGTLVVSRPGLYTRHQKKGFL